MQKALETDEPDYWEPTEPDVVIAFYPEVPFSMLPSRARSIYEAEHIKHERETRELRKQANGGKLPDDTITMIAMVDAYNWRGCSAYSGQGYALVMSPTRASLERFRDQLSAEWESLKMDQRLDARLQEREDACGHEGGDTG